MEDNQLSHAKKANEKVLKGCFQELNLAEDVWAH